MVHLILTTLKGSRKKVWNYWKNFISEFDSYILLRTNYLWLDHYSYLFKKLLQFIIMPYVTKH